MGSQTAVWLGVDLGEARVGLALSDPELTLAFPAGNIRVQGDYFQALDQVEDLIMDKCVSRVVVGHPLLLSGQAGRSAKKASRWVRALTGRLQEAAQDADIAPEQLPSVVLRDERLTTVSAHRQLYDARVDGRRHRPVVDQQSAVVLLQSALDDQRADKEY